MLRTRRCALFVLAALLALPFAARAQSGPSPQLVAALQALRAVDAAAVIAWSADAVSPSIPTGALGALEGQILALDEPDRAAMLFWLRAHGRDALHQRAATDGQIGPPLYPIDYEIRWTRMPAGFVNPTPIPKAAPAKPAAAGESLARGLFGFVSNLPLPNVSVPIASSSSSSSSTYVQGNTQVTQSRSSSTSVSAQVNVGALAGMLAEAAAQSQPPAVRERATAVLDFIGESRT